MRRSTNVHTHDVEVTDTKPIKQYSYRLNPQKLKVLQQFYFAYMPLFWGGVLIT